VEVADLAKTGSVDKDILDLARDMLVDPRYSGDEVRERIRALAKHVSTEETTTGSGAPDRSMNVDPGSGDVRLHVHTKIIARAMHVSERQVRNLVRDRGLPVIAPNTKPMIFDSAEVWKWCARARRHFDVSELPRDARMRLEEIERKMLDRHTAETRRPDRQLRKVHRKDRKPDDD
jgi:hypothetical protein